MSKCDLFKTISEIVWDKICRNHGRNNRLNEEGISRQTIIDSIQNYVEEHRTFNVFAQKSVNEVNRGGDLELYIDNGNQKFYRVLLQAKLMEINCSFQHLDRNSGSTGRKQYDTLNQFANQVNCDAYYLMYNGCPNYEDSGNDCAGFYNEKQFGCAIMTVNEIKSHCVDNATGTLGVANNPRPYGKPWRFLTCCDYEYSNGSKLYNIDEIDMDDYFRNLFTPSGLTRFITPEQVSNQQIVENNNATVHEQGWNPSARIIISQTAMRKAKNGILEI